MRTKCDGNVLGQNYNYEVQNIIKLFLIESDVAACLL